MILDIDGDDNLLISPASELETLRREHYRVDHIAVRNREVRSFPKLNGDTVELNIRIDLGTASRAGVKVLCNPDGRASKKFNWCPVAPTGSVTTNPVNGCDFDC